MDRADAPTSRVGPPGIVVDVDQASPWDRRDPTGQRAALTLVICAIVVLLPLGPNRFALAGVILVVQGVTTVVINRATDSSIARLGSFLITEHLLAVVASIVVPAAYVGSNLVTVGSLGANAAYLPPRWLRILGVVTALNTLAPPLVTSVGDAPLVICLGVVLIVHTVVNRSGAVLLAEAIARGASWQAAHDALTGLPNRRVLKTRLAELDHDQPAGLLLVDMDNFKEINDTLGHDFGDEVLCAVARRFVELDEAVLVVRLGGDEFAVVVPGDEAATERMADRLHELWADPVTVNGIEISARGSIGIAHSGRVEPSDLLRYADVAMYRAKHDGLETSWYRTQDDPHNRRRLELVQGLPEALRSGEIEPWFQTQVEISSGRVVGAEALARWHHPNYGIVGARELLELVSLTGQQRQLTETMMVQAIAEAATWPDHVRLSVNVVASDLNNARFVDVVSSSLERFGFAGERLTIEITETSVDVSSPVAIATLDAFKDLGASIALDDFGQSHSSLARLDTLAVHELKIDRSFVSRMVTDRSTAAIVDAIVGIAYRLDLRIVAEGVESVETAEAVLQAGIPIAQGFLYSRPARSGAVDMAAGPKELGCVAPTI